MSGLSLLGLEMDVLWGTDAYGRDEPAPLVAVAAASDGCAVRISSSVPPALAAQVRLDESVRSGTGDPAAAHRSWIGGPSCWRRSFP
jgi:hypothetical protein